MINSLEIFNKDVPFLKKDKNGNYKLDHWEHSNLVFHNSETINYVNSILKKHVKKLEEKMLKDIQRTHFPIHTEITFHDYLTISDSSSNFEFDGWNITSKRNNTNFVALTLYFRHLIRKFKPENISLYHFKSVGNMEVCYSNDLQKNINNLLRRNNFTQTLNDQLLKFVKKYETYQELDRDIRDLYNIYRDNLETIDKTLFE